jgi:hypothetical protein
VAANNEPLRVWVLTVNAQHSRPFRDLPLTCRMRVDFLVISHTELTHNMNENNAHAAKEIAKYIILATQKLTTKEKSH